MAVSQGWLTISLFAVVPQKGKQSNGGETIGPIYSGGDDENTTKASKADEGIHDGYLPEVGSFFNELKL